jgi:hypothetical protein
MISSGFPTKTELISKNGECLSSFHHFRCLPWLWPHLTSHRARNITVRDQQALDTCLAQLYPVVPNPSLPRQILLPKYVGVYSEPGYGNLTLSLVCNDTTATGARDGPAAPTIEDGCFLRIEPRLTAIGLAGVELQHVSVNSWIGWGYIPAYIRYRRPLLCAPVEMKIDGAGLVKAVGIVLTPDAPSLGHTWFRRI